MFESIFSRADWTFLHNRLLCCVCRTDSSHSSWPLRAYTDEANSQCNYNKSIEGTCSALQALSGRQHQQAGPWLCVQR